MTKFPESMIRLASVSDQTQGFNVYKGTTKYVAEQCQGVIAGRTCDEEHNLVSIRVLLSPLRLPQVFAFTAVSISTTMWGCGHGAGHTFAFKLWPPQDLHDPGG
jgi:hypothetical protein